MSGRRRSSTHRFLSHRRFISPTTTGHLHHRQPQDVYIIDNSSLRTTTTSKAQNEREPQMKSQGLLSVEDRGGNGMAWKTNVLLHLGSDRSDPDDDTRS
ncbi:hypothetical protein LSH36_147g09003 [Paralvinella palmiformis]|uniref:Uncharacterized protein n=1 Tax=Paralvinella palmiformis TaxID=53620 RepID=A0AAD9N8W7_9ANNE|nr:hypothetical protein LSH36_147g09003 [Paralvinella palmiformis]